MIEIFRKRIMIAENFVLEYTLKIQKKYIKVEFEQTYNENVIEIFSKFIAFFRNFYITIFTASGR